MKFLTSRAAAAVLADPGLGKTTITLAAFTQLLKAQTAYGLLIIAPVRPCYTVWPGEIAKWSNFSGLRVEVLHGPKKDEAFEREADVYVVNPDGLEWLFGVEELVKFSWRLHAKRAMNKALTHPDEKTVDLDHSGLVTKKELIMNKARLQKLREKVNVLGIDELTNFKNPKSRRHRVLKDVIDLFDIRWGLTGSPAPNGLEDLFGQAFLLDGGRALGRYVSHFRREFFDATGYGGYVLVPKPGAEEAIYERLRPLCVRYDAADHLPDLPELVESPIWVDLPAKAMAQYIEMERKLFAELDAGELATAVSAATASMKCRQIANGGIHRDQELRQLARTASEKYFHLHNAKTDALVELVESLCGKPLLVAYDFEHDVARIRKALPKAVFACDHSPKKFIEVADAFNRGEITVLCGHPKSLSHGLNLQEKSAHVAWYGMTWNLDDYDQFNRRVCRSGNQHAQVMAHLILARHTVDEIILDALGAKRRTQGALLDALNTYRKRRKK